MDKRRCHSCGFELVNVKKETLNTIKEELSPNFKSLATGWEKSAKTIFEICPRCDAYALGMEQEEGCGYEFTDQAGHTLTIHDLDERL